MSFITVAIIQYSDKTDVSTNHSTKKSENKYLVISENTEFAFWSFSNNAIGASFQRDLLDRKFNEDFELNLTEQVAKRFLEREYEGKDKPPTVVYRITLNQDSYDILTEKLKDNYEFRWLSDSQLFNKPTNWKSSQRWIIERAEKAWSYEKLDLINPNFTTKINQIIKAKEEGNLVIFVGAGVSKSSGVPLWKELIKELLNDLGTKEVDYEIIPQLYYQEHDETNYIKKIEEILDLERKKPNCIHSEIFKLNPSHIVTTNYDTFLETESKNQGKNYCVIREDQDLPYSNSSKLIIKMHGDLALKNIVLKEDDYLQYSDKFKLIENFVKSIFSSKLVLFIGFSFSDRNLKKIIESVRYILKESFNPALLFNSKSERELDIRQLKYFDNRGVKVIGYEDSIKHYLEHVKELPNLLRDINEVEEDFIIKEKAYNFLRFINNYSKEDSFHYTNEEINVIDKMYSGLAKFQDLPVIPYQYIVKIKPFALNEKEPAEYESYGFHLKTASEEIIQLLNKVDRIENAVIYYKDNPDTPEKNAEKNFKLNLVFRWLKSSAVFCIQRKYDFRDEVHNKLNLTSVSKECKCPTCLFSSFKFHEAYSTGINEFHKDESDLIHLKKAKVNFFFGEYEKCFENLKRGASIAYSNSNFHLYFLHMYNVKQIKYRVKGLFVPDHIDVRTKNDIMSEIDSYSLPTIIEELYISQISKDILHSIHCKEVYHESFNEIKDNLNSIERLYESHKDGTSQFIGPNYVINLIYAYRVYLHFTTNNLLFDIFYRDHQELTNMFLKGIFTSIVSHDSLKQKIKKVSLYDIKAIIEYSDPKILFEIIKTTFVKESKYLILDENETLDFFKLLDDFINSHITISNSWGEFVGLRDSIQFAQKRHFIVRQRFVNLFDNIILILSQLSFQFSNDPKYGECLTKIFKFIRASEYQPFSSDLYFRLFIKESLARIENVDKHLLLESCLNDNLWSDKLIEVFADALDDVSDFRITDRREYEKIINRTSYREGYKIELKSILPLYKFLDREFQNDFKNLIRNTYESINILIEAFDVGIINKNDKTELRNLLYDCVLQIPRLERIGQHTYLGDSNFWKLYNFFIEGKISLSKEQILIIQTQENIYSWLLFPVKFDYSKFNDEWLEILYTGAFYLKYLLKARSQLKEVFEIKLKNTFNEVLSEIYWTHLY